MASVYIKRGPGGIVKTLTRFNEGLKVITDREIATSASCSSPAFVAAFLSSPYTKLTQSSRESAFISNGNSAGIISVRYDYKYANGPTFLVECSEVFTMRQGIAIAVAGDTVFTVTNPNAPFSEMFYYEYGMSHSDSKLQLAAPIDLSKGFPVFGYSSFHHFAILTPQSMQFLDTLPLDYSTPILKDWRVPPSAGFNTSCVVRLTPVKGGAYVLQSCESIPVPKLWWFGAAAGAADLTIKFIGQVGCPTGSTLDGPTLLRPEMISIGGYRDFRVDVVSNCQVANQIGPVRMTLLMLESGAVSSFYTRLDLSVARAASDIAFFATFAV